jgi:hypothetical protein
MENRKRGTVAVLFGICLVGILACIGQSYYARYEATRLERTLAKLTVGVTTEHDAKEALRPFRAEADKIGGRVQNTEAWGPEYAVTSRGLSILHLARPVRFSIGTVFNNGILVRKVVGLRIGNGSDCCFYEVTQSTTSFADLPPNLMHEGVFVRKKNGFAHIYIDAEAPPDTETTAFDVDVACLTSIAGCSRIDQILPTFKHFE